MKRAKILLTAVTMIAIAGGVLAFKAHKFTDKAIYTFQASPSSCNFVTFGTTGSGASVSSGTIVTAGSGVPAVSACQTSFNYNPTE